MTTMPLSRITAASNKPLGCSRAHQRRINGVRQTATTRAKSRILGARQISAELPNTLVRRSLRLRAQVVPALPYS